METSELGWYNMTFPDVTAYRLDQAVDILKKAGVSFHFEIVAPPVDAKKIGTLEQPFKMYRILKQDEVGNNLLTLIIAEEQESNF